MPVRAVTVGSRHPQQFFGSWELGLLVLMALLYIGGALINPAFFGTPDALHALLRDSARYGVMAVGMTFVIVNKDIDLSVGSTFGLVGVAFSILFSPTHYDLGLAPALGFCLLLGAAIGLINGVLVTILKVPAFIATLTMLLIGRGLVLGLTGGKNIAYPAKAQDYAGFFQISETNALGFNNQIIIFIVVAVIGAIVLAKTRWGYETFATGGNEQAAIYAGIPTRWVRIRAYLLSSLSATLAGLMAIAQDKGVTSQFGLSAELIVIASVIIGGASILGGRGRIAGSCLGTILTVLINKVLREGWPTTRTVKIDGVDVTVNALSQLPAGAVPAFLGLILLAAVLIEPFVLRRQLPARLWAWLRGRPPPPPPESGGVAMEGIGTRGTVASDRALHARGMGKFFARRDALAIVLVLTLWATGLYLRPDYWGNLANTFAILLNFTEVALLTVGLTYVIACGDIDLSVGAVLALAGSTAAYGLKVMGVDPMTAVMMGMLAGMSAGIVNGLLTVGFGLPSFIATLGMYYIARGLAAWIVAGQQLTGFTERFNLFGRKIGDILNYYGVQLPEGVLRAVADAVSVQTLWTLFVAVIAGIVLGLMPFGQQVLATGGNRRAADYAGINTKRVRFLALAFAGTCAAMAGIINVAYFRSFNPVAGQFRELDAIAAVIIGGGSIFGGYGTIIGSLAGAAVITLVRALLQLNIITADGRSIVLPQHWVNVFIGLILIAAVLIDIWLRQADIFGRVRQFLAKRRTSPG
ncbi:ABC transporter permease [Nordella sp. HKS 07]|uniref:ABC transporter permease n=1 Tax=Nordella sp. HKS 07 TaxID=2712222 RepID=UPI0013E19165|nr:ABC transporter permease [Nordella sp. HKS 07]QIG47446.1 ABC transporter permease [Nordella sp. HKS 07]